MMSKSILLPLAFALTTTVWIRWQTPVQGSAPTTYLVQVQDLEGDYDHTFSVPAVPDGMQSLAFDAVEYVHRYQARIAAQDRFGRQGPWCAWTPIYDRELPPPQP